MEIITHYYLLVNNKKMFSKHNFTSSAFKFVRPQSFVLAITKTFMTRGVPNSQRLIHISLIAGLDP